MQLSLMALPLTDTQAVLGVFARLYSLTDTLELLGKLDDGAVPGHVLETLAYHLRSDLDLLDDLQPEFNFSSFELGDPPPAHPSPSAP